MPSRTERMLNVVLLLLLLLLVLCFSFSAFCFCFGRQRTSYDRALVNYIRIEEKKNIRNKLLIYVYSYRLWWALVARWVSSSSSWYVSYLEGSPVRTHVYRTLANVILYYLLSSIADSNCWNWVRLVHSALANASQQQNPTLLISIFFWCCCYIRGKNLPQDKEQQQNINKRKGIEKLSLFERLKPLASVISQRGGKR